MAAHWRKWPCIVRRLFTTAHHELMKESIVHDAIETVARNSYGRMVAYVAMRTGDIADAEDALSEALVAALQTWPTKGIPDKPEAWLLHVAHNRLIDASRRVQTHRDAEETLRQLLEETERACGEPEAFPDERLKLLFVCAHPAIDPAARTPLMLQAVLGIDAARIASAFLVAPAAMSQRLVRAKNKIRDAAIPFLVPDPSEWEERISFVLDAIYTAYTTGWECVNEGGARHHVLAGEAIAIGRTLVQLTPEEPETLGLLALMLHCGARREARYKRSGEFVPLNQQDTSLWSRAKIEEAERLLRRALVIQRAGRYQLEAAIQSIHADRLRTGKTDWQQIALLYEGLMKISPSVGSCVGWAVALAQGGQPSIGLNALDAVPANQITSYQPYWAARGHVLEMLRRKDEARDAFNRGASLTDDVALRNYLLGRSKAAAGV